MLAMASSGGSIEATDVDGARNKINGDDLYVTDDGTMNVDDMDDDLIVVDVGETSHDDATMTAAAAVAEAAAVAGGPERLSRPHQDMGLVSDPSAPSAAKAQQRVGEKVSVPLKAFCFFSSPPCVKDEESIADSWSRYSGPYTYQVVSRQFGTAIQGNPAIPI